MHNMVLSPRNERLVDLLECLGLIQFLHIETHIFAIFEVTGHQMRVLLGRPLLELAAPLLFRDGSPPSESGLDVEILNLLPNFASGGVGV